jgi:hypothetical protein
MEIFLMACVYLLYISVVRYKVSRACCLLLVAPAVTRLSVVPQSHLCAPPTPFQYLHNTLPPPFQHPFNGPVSDHTGLRCLSGVLCILLLVGIEVSAAAYLLLPLVCCLFLSSLHTPLCLPPLTHALFRWLTSSKHPRNLLCPLGWVFPALSERSLLSPSFTESSSSPGTLLNLLTLPTLPIPFTLQAY